MKRGSETDEEDRSRRALCSGDLGLWRHSKGSRGLWRVFSRGVTGSIREGGYWEEISVPYALGQGMARECSTGHWAERTVHLGVWYAN